MAVMHGFVAMDTGKRAVIEWMTAFKDKKHYGADMQLFTGLTFDPVGYDGIEEYRGYYVGTGLAKDEFDSPSVRKNGDLDIIFLPYNDDKIFYERAAVFVVRVASPDFKNLEKGPRSSGVAEVKTLLKDGFPLVGLLHMCMPKPLTVDQAYSMNIEKEPVKLDMRHGEQVKVHAMNGNVPVYYDWLPWYAMNNQMRWMISSGLPKYVAINAFGMAKNADGTHNLMTTLRFKGFTSGYFNPRVNAATQNAVSAHFYKYGEQRYRKLEIWDKNE